MRKTSRQYRDREIHGRDRLSQSETPALRDTARRRQPRGDAASTSETPRRWFAKDYRCFLLGLDIAPAQDRNACSIILDKRVLFYDVNARQELTMRRREIVRADHPPAMSFADHAIVTRNLMMDQRPS